VGVGDERRARQNDDGAELGYHRQFDRSGKANLLPTEQSSSIADGQAAEGAGRDGDANERGDRLPTYGT